METTKVKNDKDSEEFKNFRAVVDSLLNVVKYSELMKMRSVISNSELHKDEKNKMFAYLDDRIIEARKIVFNTAMNKLLLGESTIDEAVTEIYRFGDSTNQIQSPTPHLGPHTQTFLENLHRQQQMKNQQYNINQSEPWKSADHLGMNRQK